MNYVQKDFYLFSSLGITLLYVKVSPSASSGDECLTLALKGRCQNQLKRRQAGPERLMGNGRLAGGALRSVTVTTSSASRLVERAAGGLCEVHFLPLVIGVGDSNRTQRLRCVGRFYIISLNQKCECAGGTGENIQEVDLATGEMQCA